MMQVCHTIVHDFSMKVHNIPTKLINSRLLKLDGLCKFD